MVVVKKKIVIDDCDDEPLLMVTVISYAENLSIDVSFLGNPVHFSD